MVTYVTSRTNFVDAVLISIGAGRMSTAVAPDVPSMWSGTSFGGVSAAPAFCGADASFGNLFRGMPAAPGGLFWTWCWT